MQSPEQMNLAVEAVRQNRYAVSNPQRKAALLLNPCRPGRVMPVAFNERCEPLLGDRRVPITVRRSFTQRPLNQNTVALRIAELKAGSHPGRRIDVICRNNVFDIVDGQHLYFAASRARVPVELQLWVNKESGDDPSEDDERILNTVLNRVRGQSPQIVYRNHVGESRQFFDNVMSNSKFWKNRISLGQTRVAKMSIITLVGLSNAYLGGSNAGGVASQLGTLDANLTNPETRALLWKFLELTGDVFSEERMRALKGHGIPPSDAMRSWMVFCREIRPKMPNGKATARARKMVGGWLTDAPRKLREAHDG